MTTAQILEKGDIYFFFRPEPSEHEPPEPESWGRLYAVLHPRDQTSYRLIALIRLDQFKQAEENILLKKRWWGEVILVKEKAADIIWELREKHGQINEGEVKKTIHMATPVGVGKYFFSRHADHLHFSYTLDPQVLPLPQPLIYEPVRENDYIIRVQNNRTDVTFLDQPTTSFLLKEAGERGRTENAYSAIILADLRLERNILPITPLYHGSWD